MRLRLGFGDTKLKNRFTVEINKALVDGAEDDRDAHIGVARLSGHGVHQGLVGGRAQGHQVAMPHAPLARDAHHSFIELARVAVVA